MAEFAIGDVVCLKGGSVYMCVENVDPPGMPPNVRTLWFDHGGALHRDGFDPLCLVQIRPPAVVVPQGWEVLPHEGAVS